MTTFKNEIFPECYLGFDEEKISIWNCQYTSTKDLYIKYYRCFFSTISTNSSPTRHRQFRSDVCKDVSVCL